LRTYQRQCCIRGGPHARQKRVSGGYNAGARLAPGRGFLSTRSRGRRTDRTPHPSRTNSLKQNVVDGQENPLPTIKAGKFDEVQKYLVLTGHIITPRLVVVNEAFWQGLSPADRTLIGDAIKAGIVWHDDELQKQMKALVDQFRQAGVQVITPDVNLFRAPVVAKVPKLFEAKWGAGMYEKIQAIQ
jgi:TRAP-type C4-dicarboxylate transport system substrate-binding protein